MCNFLRWNYWSLVLWEKCVKMCHSDSEFGPVCKHVTVIVFLTDRWVGLWEHLVRRCNGTHFKNINGYFEGTLPRATHLNWGRFAVALPISPLVIFFYVFFFKSRVYVHRPRTLQDLKTNIQEEIANIAATLAGVMTNTRNRFTQCMENGGRHLSDVIFKTN